MTRLFSILCTVVACLFIVEPVSAVTVTITNSPTTISEESFTLSASISGATAGTNYLRIDLYKDQTTNYFGETYNGSDYYNGSTHTQYFPVTIQSGTVWTGDIQGRVGNPSLTQYDATGTYKIRLRRYTGGGGYTTSEANNSAVTVAIVIATPTPSPTPSPTPVPTSNPPTATPTATPTAKPSAVPTVAPSATPKPTASPIITESNESSESMILGVTRNEQTDKPEELKEDALLDTSERTLLSEVPVAGVLVAGGSIMLIISGYLFVKGRASGTIGSNAEDS